MTVFRVGQLGEEEEQGGGGLYFVRQVRKLELFFVVMLEFIFPIMEARLDNCQYYNTMLKRRAKLQKYISTLKKKQIKKNNLKEHNTLKHKIEVAIEGPLAKKEDEHMIRNEQILNVEIDGADIQEEVDERGTPCWNDSDDQQKQKVVLGGANKFKKLGKFGDQNQIQLEEYERKVGKFYAAKYKKVNWAQQAENIQQKDINDYLNEDMYYSDKKPSKKSVKFHSKTTQKHQSIVSGMAWHKHVLFTCGLDHKLKVNHFKPEQPNPELKLVQQKDIYIKDLPLSSCHYHVHDQNSSSFLILGSLRKNLVKVDTEKWMPEFITSAFLKDFKNYQNLRVSKQTGFMSVFSHNRIGFLDKNFVFAGSLLTNEKVQDLCFNGDWGVYGVTNEAFYQWDTRKMQIVRMQKKYLGFTSITSTPTSIAIGSKLGTVYIYQSSTPTLPQPLQNSNILTNISQLSSNISGTLCLSLSKWKSNAIRLIDSITGKSIGDWPNTKTKTGIPICANFGYNDCFGVGSANGGVSVYQVESEII